MKVNLLNYMEVNDSVNIIDIYINSFEMFLETKNYDLLKIGYMYNGGVLCSNSTKVFAERILSSERLYELFNEIVFTLYQNNTCDISAKELDDLLNIFNFKLYENDYRTICKKIIFYNLINIHNLIESYKDFNNGGNLQFIITVDNLEYTLFDNQSIKDFYKSNLCFVDTIEYLYATEKAILIDTITDRIERPKTYKCLLLDEEIKSVSKHIKTINAMLKNNCISFVNRRRKRRENKNTVNYFVCDDGSVFLVLTWRMLGHNSGDKVVIRILDPKSINYDFKFEKEKVQYRDLNIKRDFFERSDGEMNLLNKIREELGLKETTIEKTGIISKIELEYDN